MKTCIFILLLLSTLVYSQDNYQPDKLLSKSAVSQNCTIHEVNSDYIVVNANDNSESKILLETISEISIGDLGTVFSESAGFSTSLKSLNAFLSKRNSKHNAINKQPELVCDNETRYFNGAEKWTFAIHYFPSIEKQLVFTYNPYIYRLSSSSYIDPFYRPIYYELEQNLVSMESQLGYNVTGNTFVVLSVGYSSDLYKSTSTNTDHNSYDGTTVTRIDENQNSMAKFLFEIGLKHYFGHFNAGNVNPFITFGIGKQFAFSDNYNRSYSSVQTNNYEYTNNENEFMEGLNSPIIVTIGFWTDYSISESLSLSGFLKVKYNSASSKYKWNNLYLGLAYDHGEEDVENITVRFKTGLGLNFFF